MRWKHLRFCTTAAVGTPAVLPVFAAISIVYLVSGTRHMIHLVSNHIASTRSPKCRTVDSNSTVLVFVFPSLPFPSLPFPSLPFPSLPFPFLSFPFLSFPFLSFPFLSFPFLSFPFSGAGVLGRSDGGVDGIRLGAKTRRLGRLGQARPHLHWCSAHPGLICFCPFWCFFYMPVVGGAGCRHQPAAAKPPVNISGRLKRS